MDERRQDIHTTGIPVLCRACEARHKGMCGALTADELTRFARSTHKARHAPGDELVGESLPTASYANVMRGVVKLTKGLEDGRQQVVGLQFAPDFLGRLFSDASAVTAEAASDVELCVSPRDALERMIADSPALEHRLMQQTLRELDEARDWMVTLGRKDAAGKVASFLLLIAEHGDPERAPGTPVQFNLPLSRGDIADFLGLTIETVSRQLTRLRTGGTIRLDGLRHVVVTDIDRLRRLAG